MIHCLILEDEHPAQQVLLDYVTRTPFLECIGVYESGLDVCQEKMINTDLLFLDIQLPELNGLNYLRTIPNPPRVIVTTAYVNYALEAFEEAVVDYLLKPFSFERFFKAVNRVRLNANDRRKTIDKNLFLYSDKTVFNMNVDDVLYLKAEVDYVKITSQTQSILILDSLRNWNDKLGNFNFIQVHRSYIINIDKITKVYGNQVFIGPNAIPIGKTFKTPFMERLK